MRRLYFLRDFRAFTGGHLKVWHYYCHALASRVFRPVVHFTERSRFDSSNPWLVGGAEIVGEWRPGPGDAVFLGGTDWQWLDGSPLRRPGPRTPILNIVQGLGHADPDDPRSAWLSRPAIRLCVNPLIETALRGLPVSGAIVTIPMGLDTPTPTGDLRRGGVVVGAAKQPALGRELALCLTKEGIAVQLLDTMLPRSDYLQIMAGADTAIFLPERREGFYLPALEAMALGATVICPDCVGNRVYLDDSVNAFMPAYDRDAILAALRSALGLSVAQRQALRERARATASHYTLRRERDAFLDILDNVDALWTHAE